MKGVSGSTKGRLRRGYQRNQYKGMDKIMLVASSIPSNPGRTSRERDEPRDLTRGLGVTRWKSPSRTREMMPGYEGTEVGGDDCEGLIACMVVSVSVPGYLGRLLVGCGCGGWRGWSLSWRSLSRGAGLIQCASVCV